MKSLLKPDQSVMAALATAAAVFVVYQTALPSLCEVHAASPHNLSVMNSQKKAMWTAAGISAGAFLLTKDANVFVAGGIVFLAEEWQYRHANAVHPATGKMVPYSSQDMSGAYTPDNTTDEAYSEDYSQGY